MIFRTLLLAAAFASTLLPATAGQLDLQRAQFKLCSKRVHSTCVIDGDTFRWRGERVRLADIDAPETHPSRCQAEADLGLRATLRLQELLSAGPFALIRTDRDHDKYGRQLRLVRVAAGDAGAILVAEGLARTWDGSRHPWC